MSIDDIMTASNSLTARPMSPTHADSSECTGTQTPSTENTVVIPSLIKDGAMANSQTLSDDDFASFEEVKVKEQTVSQNSAAVAMDTEKDQSDGVTPLAVKIILPGGSSEVKEAAEGGSSPLVQDLSQQSRCVLL